MVSDDVDSAWKKATDGRAVDYVVFALGKPDASNALRLALLTVQSFPGATPDMSSFKLTKGFTINPPNITTKAMLNVLCTMPDSAPRPKLIAATSIGVTKDSPFPFVYKPLYGYLIREPHADKLGLERVLAHASGRPWNDKEPRADITTVDEVNWQDRKGLPPSGSLEICVLRLPIFVEQSKKSAPLPPSSPPPVDSEAPDTKKGEEEKPKYRVGGPELRGTYTISREEVAHFIAENALKNWDQFKGKAITVSR